MNAGSKYNLFDNWFRKEYEYDNDIIFYDSEYLRLSIKEWDKWENLLNKYTEEQLINYFMKIVRKELPELKGTKLFFTSMNPMDNVKDMDKLPHRII